MARQRQWVPGRPHLITTLITGTLAIAFTSAALILAPLTTSSPAHADVNDFEIESFDAEYALGLDESGRSTLRTKEHIIAVFPEFDQNRGLIRDIPRIYDGHNTDITVLSVTDEHGEPRNYWTEPYGDYLAVTMAVPEGSFVHGAQHYVIEYTQRDVTRFFEDTGVDEFYWDVNGTEWAQPFGKVSARITLESNLTERFDGGASCYRGAFGSTEQCEILDEDRVFTVEEWGLEPGENVSFALAFTPGTFAPAPTPDAPFFERVPLLLWAGLASFAATIITFFVALFGRRGSKTGRAIIAQYEPPQGVSAALAAELLRKRGQAMTATLLDLAVRRKLRLLHHAETGQYGAQALEASNLLPIELRVYNRMFTGTASGGVEAVERGKTLWFTKTSTRLGDAAAALTTEARKEARSRGLIKKASGKAMAAVAILPVLGLLLLVVHALLIDNELLFILLLAIGINVLVWSILGMIAALAVPQRVTPKGALMLDHLQGLREFIRVAEADRIRMLQSASGAEVTHDFIVQIYERVLPYAVLFGFEREWQAELARYYRESPPEWVHGEGNFTQALPIFALATAVHSAPKTAPISSGSGSGGSFSSSSGGSSGGGFSGGGGGGGGGRGI